MVLLGHGGQIAQEDGEWIVVCKDGTIVSVDERPVSCLLLLEMEPTAELLNELSTFPFYRLICLGLKSGLSRYVYGAMKWLEYMPDKSSYKELLTGVVAALPRSEQQRKHKIQKMIKSING